MSTVPNGCRVYVFIHMQFLFAEFSILIPRQILFSPSSMFLLRIPKRLHIPIDKTRRKTEGICSLWLVPYRIATVQGSYLICTSSVTFDWSGLLNLTFWVAKTTIRSRLNVSILTFESHWSGLLNMTFRVAKNNDKIPVHIIINIDFLKSLIRAAEFDIRSCQTDGKRYPR